MVEECATILAIRSMLCLDWQPIDWEAKSNQTTRRPQKMSIGKLVETWLDVYQDLYILNCCNYTQGYPSWTPDFDQTLLPLMRGSRRSFYSAHGSSKAMYGRATGHRGRELLLLHGMTVDHISKTGHHMLNEPTLQDPVLLQWRNPAALTTLPPTAFWTTLTLGQDEYSNRMSADRLQAFHKFLNDCNCFAEPQTGHTTREFARLDRVSGMNFFITRQGRMGLAKPDVQVNDEVCVLLGGQTPFILRPRRHGEHTLCFRCVRPRASWMEKPW